jgi:hypothetical protein
VGSEHTRGQTALSAEFAAMAEDGSGGQPRAVVWVAGVVAVFALVAGGAVGFGVLRSYWHSAGGTNGHAQHASMPGPLDSGSLVTTSALPSDGPTPSPSGSLTPSVAAGSPGASTTARSTGTITGPGSVHMCVDVRNNTSVNGNPVELWHCHGARGQRWTMNADHTIRAFGKCLSVVGDGTANRTQVQLWTCDGTGGQQWIPAGEGALFNPRSGRCLDDPKAETSNGTELQIYDCNRLFTQQWATPPLP